MPKIKKIAFKPSICIKALLRILPPILGSQLEIVLKRLLMLLALTSTKPKLISSIVINTTIPNHKVIRATKRLKSVPR